MKAASPKPDIPPAAVMGRPEPPLELILEHQITPATDRAIRRLLCACFPADAQAFTQNRAWNESTPAFTLISRDGDLAVGHVAIVIRAIRCGRAPVTVAGVQSLCVAPQKRGTGLARALLAAALAEAARRRTPRFGLLFCVPALGSFYRALGWSRLDRPVTMLDEHGLAAPIPAKNIAMQITLSDDPFPPGPIDLGGRDW